MKLKSRLVVFLLFLPLTTFARSYVGTSSESGDAACRASASQMTWCTGDSEPVWTQWDYSQVDDELWQCEAECQKKKSSQEQELPIVEFVEVEEEDNT